MKTLAWFAVAVLAAIGAASAVMLLHVVPGGLFLLAAPLQLSAHLRRRYAAVHRSLGYHRAWMLRFLAYAIAVMRALSITTFTLFPVSMRDIGAPLFWIGPIVSALAAEWWIRRTASLPIAATAIAATCN